MMILFTTVQNQTQLHLFREVHLGGKRLEQTNVIPSKVKEGERKVGR